MDKIEEQFILQSNKRKRGREIEWEKENETQIVNKEKRKKTIFHEMFV